MNTSRRNFIRGGAAGAVGVPFLLSGAAEAQLAADDIDWGMGFPAGATLLNRNENPIGPSAKAIHAAKLGVEKSFRYADSILIKSLLSDHHKVPEDHLIVGTGSGEILNLAPLVYLPERNHKMVATLESYRPIPGRAERLGRQVEWVQINAKDNFAYDVDRLLAAVDADTRLLFMVSPNNPTGSVLSFDDARRLADGLPNDVILILDGAYRDFQEDGRDEIDLVREGYENILITRTFSKIYAMAGLRAGYGIAHPDIISKLSRFGGSPTSTNMAGFGAMAASLGDVEFVEESREFVRSSRKYYERELGALGIKTIAGPPNFILAETGENTQSISDALKSRKIFVRPAVEWGLPTYTRISYGRPHENATFVAALKEITQA